MEMEDHGTITVFHPEDFLMVNILLLEHADTGDSFLPSTLNRQFLTENLISNNSPIFNLVTWSVYDIQVSAYAAPIETIMQTELLAELQLPKMNRPLLTNQVSALNSVAV